jgi:betaine-aldehyde dehydrogenase
MFEYAARRLRAALHGDAFNNLGDGMFGIVTREPVGVVGIITPWNFPFLILCERVPYMLAVGLHHRRQTVRGHQRDHHHPGRILRKRACPMAVMNVVTGSGSTIGQALTEHMDIDMLSFTGSTAVGRQLRQGGGRQLQEAGLELGGKNPQIVFADADLEDAADGVAFGIALTPASAASPARA